MLVDHFQMTFKLIIREIEVNFKLMIGYHAIQRRVVACSLMRNDNC